MKIKKSIVLSLQHDTHSLKLYTVQGQAMKQLQIKLQIQSNPITTEPKNMKYGLFWTVVTKLCLQPTLFSRSQEQTTSDINKVNTTIEYIKLKKTDS